MSPGLSDADLAKIDRHLTATDSLLEAAYPGDSGSRQPVHTVYIPADQFTPDLASRWGAQALAAVEAAGGMESLATHVGIEAALIGPVAERVAHKLASEPIEDLRLDFEDGYGDRGDTEDADVVTAASKVSDAVASGSAPPFIGIRFKCFEKPTRARGLRTLDLFIGGLLDAGPLPDGLVLTLPKVTTTAQVEAMVIAVDALERAHGLEAGRIRFEVQVETPQLVLGADGRSPLAQLPVVAPGRISGLHYGTYDYSASLGIAAGYQSMEHPAADLAKEIMQLTVAGTGIRLSDGSTNILPVGERATEAWTLHARLVRRSLERGFYQGWDLHPHQLATRYLATYAFYRNGYPDAASRLRAYLAQEEGAVMDEPATARALAWFVLRGVQCGAIDAAEMAADIGIRVDELTVLAHPRLADNTLARS
ncbi:HpcH/HpaI aldolase/citrate lyase family protein [Microbacterium sp. AK031]|uniref:HpcH/HpaI aldolase/citrate lyase family protein n=1 Tax=Microbacterium sp. AK031 TaxID=2723076 RepID=UPI00216A3127|nr:HpcH/HpaI aldolase/citrate lyase family protein [Microbacterium sp. AK031]MCS3844411.1 citrate lyase beta subunit [Microbacterium sp. AK031]